MRKAQRLYSSKCSCPNTWSVFSLLRKTNHPSLGVIEQKALLSFGFFNKVNRDRNVIASSSAGACLVDKYRLSNLLSRCNGFGVFLLSFSYIPDSLYTMSIWEASKFCILLPCNPKDSQNVFAKISFHTSALVRGGGNIGFRKRFTPKTRDSAL